MTVLESENISVVVRDKIVIEEDFSPGGNNDFLTISTGAPGGIELSYFDLLNETPEFSEAAILLEDEIIEYCYVKNGKDGRQYFGFDRCLPGEDEYDLILNRHKLIDKMEANTFERYPSGKTVLSRRGRILEVNQLGAAYV